MRDEISMVPRVGMGCWAIGGPFWNGQTPVGYSGANDTDSRRAIHAAWACGVRVFDTSAVYGAGHSEILLGECLADKQDAVLVSKFGHSFDGKTKQMTGPRFDPQYIEGSVEASRKRLRRDCIDVMLLHLNELPVADAVPAFDTLAGLRERGWIGAFGWSTDFPERINAFAGVDGFGVVEHAMNLFFDAPSMCAAARANGHVQLIRSPLAMGVLSGKFSKGRKVAPDDVRANDATWQGYFDERAARPDCARKLGSVRELITSGGRTPAQGALCWLLAKSPNVVPVPGAKTADQVEENAGALTHGPLPQGIMDEIEAVLDRPPEGPPRAR